jgi:hypothetical protein
LKITQNHAKLSQEHSKKLTKSLFLDTPKWLFTSRPGYLAHAKKIIENDQKNSYLYN